MVPMYRAAYMRLYPWLIASCFGIVVTASAQSDYLATVGPSPLRFQEPRPATSVRLPPLPREKPAPVISVPAAETNATNVTVTVQSPEPVAMAEPVANTNEPAVTPEILIETFRRHGSGDRGRETTVVLPQNFVPPTMSKPTSTATYETP